MTVFLEMMQLLEVVYLVGFCNEPKSIKNDIFYTHANRYSPIGIASIIAGKLAEVEDFGALVAEVGLYVVTVMTGLLIHGCIVLPLLYLIMTRKNPLKVVKAVLQALLTAFGTSSR